MPTGDILAIKKQLPAVFLFFFAEGFAEGYQSVPVDWGLSSARKRGFFKLVAEMSGSQP